MLENMLNTKKGKQNQGLGEGKGFRKLLYNQIALFILKFDNVKIFSCMCL